MKEQQNLQEARTRLIEAGGRASQDLGTGRIVGQILIYLYLQASECSLDTIAEDLGLSKASVSIAVRQLEQFGMAHKVWKSGDKRNYYKSADNIAKALQQGLLSLVRQKVQHFGGELQYSLDLVDSLPENATSDEATFLRQRIERAKKLQRNFERVLDNPLVNFLTGIKN
jgi:HTH-type transcriptional regulator, glycine betaine synthesis regulator